jgi:hypothetical protein
LNYGLLMSAVLLAGIGALCIALLRASGKGAALPMLMFFMVASTATSIASKTTVLGMFVVLVLLFIRPERLGKT